MDEFFWRVSLARPKLMRRLRVSVPTVLAIFCGLISPSPGWAYQDRTFYVGLSPLQIGLFDRVTAEDSGKDSSLGTLAPYQLSMGASFDFRGHAFFQPRLIYSLIPRKDSSENIEERLFGISTAVGENFSGSFWDWNFSLGVLEKETLGKGGSYTDPLGASFEYPSRKEKAKLVTTGVGLGFERDVLRWGMDLIFFGVTNSEKRSANLMLTLAWKGDM